MVIFFYLVIRVVILKTKFIRKRKAWGEHHHNGKVVPNPIHDRVLEVKTFNT